MEDIKSFISEVWLKCDTDDIQNVDDMYIIYERWYRNCYANCPPSKNEFKKCLLSINFDNIEK